MSDQDGQAAALGVIDMTIEDRKVQVPAGETILRALQFLEIDLYPCRLCWNGDCDNCRVVFLDPETGDQLSAKACLTCVSPGLEVRQIPVRALWPEPAIRAED